MTEPKNPESNQPNPASSKKGGLVEVKFLILAK